MAKLNSNEIRERARNYLAKAPQGIRYMELVKMVHESAPETPINTVHGAVHGLLSKATDIVRPSRGLWVLKEFADTAPAETEPPTVTVPVETVPEGKGGQLKISEDQFYSPFAEWLRLEVGEVVESMVLGGSTFKSKWGTPDVIGVFKPRKSDFVQFPIEIVSAEIKIEPSQSVVAFGQACAYRLFSHKTYVVMPNSMAGDDQSRLEALCSIYGVGLVLFAPNLDEPQFRIAVKAQRFEPDMFYANEFARRLHEISKADFDRLF